MIRGLYAAATGLLTQETHYETIAQNLANVSTNGYRRHLTATHATSSQPDFATFMQSAVDAVDTLAGQQHTTGVPTDLTLEGDGYFAIATAHGEAYTRNGAFLLDDQQRLVTTDGLPVLGEQGPITIAGTRWEVTRNGQVLVDGRPADRLKLVAIPDFSTARSLGNARWSTPTTQPATNVQVQQGCLEASNVNPIGEMVALISATRLFQANQQCLQAQDATLERAVNDIGRV